MSEEFTKRLEEINRLAFLRVAEEFTAEHLAAEGDTQALKQMNQALADLLMTWADGGWIEAAIAMPIFGGADVLVASVNVPGVAGVTIDLWKRERGEGFAVEVMWMRCEPSNFSGATLAQALAAAVEGMGK